MHGAEAISGVEKQPDHYQIDDLIRKNKNHVSFEEVLKRNVQLSCELTMHEVDWSPQHTKRMIIVGGGPSLSRNLDRLKEEKNAFIMTTNGVHDYLIANGIKPDGCIFVDAHPDLYRLFKPRKGVLYFVASQCHLSMFIKLEGYAAFRWHCDNGGGWEAETVPEESILVMGGSTAVLRAPFLSYVMGFRDFVFYGLDSSFDGEKEHAYEQSKVASHLTVTFRGREFQSNYQMACQARDFIINKKRIERNHCNVEVVGDGLIPYIYETWDESTSEAEILCR